MEGIDGFDTARDFEIDFFFRENVADFFFDFFETFCGRFVAGFDKFFQIIIATAVDIAKSDIGELDTEATHIKSVGQGSENFESFFGDFLLFVGRECGEGAGVMKTVGEFNNKDANVGAGGNKKTEKIVFGFWEVRI